MEGSNKQKNYGDEIRAIRRRLHLHTYHFLLLQNIQKTDQVVIAQLKRRSLSPPKRALICLKIIREIMLLNSNSNLNSANST